MKALHWLRQRGPGLFVLLLLAGVLSAASIGLAGYHQPPAQGASPPAASWAVLTAAGVHDDLAAVLADQRQADRDHREAWIADGYSSDFSALVSLADQAQGTDRLNVDARRFSTDGYAYLSGYAGAGLSPGWQARYAQVRADLNVLAADAGLAPVPASSGAVTAAPDPENGVKPPASASAGSANACTSTTTNTASSSDTGASSQSVAVKTKCGTQSTTVTHKQSVSAKGKVTNTTTTTTSG
jgi:hypothetical protein